MEFCLRVWILSSPLLWKCIQSLPLSNNEASVEKVTVNDVNQISTWDPSDSPEYGDYVEGDIMGDPEEIMAEVIGPLNAITRPWRRWENGIVPYKIGPGYSETQRQKIRNALFNLQHRARVNGELCVQFVQRTNQKDFILVHKGSGCSSYVGRQGRGQQRLSLGSGCVGQRGIVQHEFLHAMGFHHEQKRADRDDYVTIMWDNIKAGREGNFRKLREGVNVDHLNTPYDYRSVMHYGAKAFAIDRKKPTIVPKRPYAGIGQRQGVSEMDIERVQIFYDCLDAADSVHFKNLAVSPQNSR